MALVSAPEYVMTALDITRLYVSEEYIFDADESLRLVNAPGLSIYSRDRQSNALLLWITDIAHVMKYNVIEWWHRSASFFESSVPLKINTSNVSRTCTAQRLRNLAFEVVHVLEVQAPDIGSDTCTANEDGELARKAFLAGRVYISATMAVDEIW